SPYKYVLNGAAGQDIGPTCPAPSIRGTVVGVDGSPLAGVAIRAIDEWGNVYTGVSKQDPPGAYDMPVTAVIGSYQVLVIENEAPLSAAVLVRYSEAQGAQNAVCHVLNWRRVR
ncbi:MAG TPA: hypothetical protein VER55_02700, partial [Ardenticatenaceae bacterium]|nr:hypothetical protein [Ardenticatenaceae bacterium]